MGLFRSKPKYDDATIRQAIANLKRNGWYAPSNHAIEDECEQIKGRNVANRFDERIPTGTAGRRRI